MLQLYQFPLCPFSRKVRLLMGEKTIAHELVRELPWEMRDEFQLLTPTGRTPVLHDAEADLTISDSQAICEYLEETERKNPMICGSAKERAEIRRLVAYFDELFYGDVVAPLMHERMRKRLVVRQSPDAQILREAMKLANVHLDYIDYLIDHRKWLGGSSISLADLAAAAHISVADYLGGLDWKAHEQAANWYRTFKSRPSFGVFLRERMEVIPPPPHYDQIDF